MRPFDDDYEDLDDFEFDNLEAGHRPTSERQRAHHKSAGRKRLSKPHKERWESDYSETDDYDDYFDDEFDKHYGARIR